MVGGSPEPKLGAGVAAYGRVDFNASKALPLLEVKSSPQLINFVEF